MSPNRDRWWKSADPKWARRFTVSARPSALQLFKAAGAAILAWFVCSLIFPGTLPLFAAIAALIVVQESVDQSLTKGLERVVGVLLGVSVALGAGAVFGPRSWLFVAAILVAMGVGWLLRMSSTSTNQIAITALLMIALGGSEFGYGVERLVETAIGAALGVAINAIVVAPVRTTTHAEIVDLALNASHALDRLADALAAPRDEAWLENMLVEARKLQNERSTVHASLRSARESLRLNPRGRRHRQQLLEDDALFQRLQPIVTQVIGMSRALYDLYDSDLVTDPSVVGMVEEIRRASHDLELLVHVAEDTEAAPAEPALTAPYTIPRPHPQHWVLIGSLMEDLRRVRGRITGELE
ncbi:FUSC family protein [Leucobacter denitrificans]|uniref:FUSC family protein n=1 Tax=Leucobacter denitrificans TaxID=683042 RepID=A0A7G9S5F6_9MICO|nr:FUSC family protein [Leucobacter denitrificans]QNN63081.1 FUSC family protein [Leucobacter denitrificans]